MKNFSLPHEVDYNHKAREYFNAVSNVKLPSGKIVDLLAKDTVYEIDYTHKWAESIGQSLQYARETGKKPAIIFIFYLPSDTQLLHSVLPLIMSLHINVYTIDRYSFKIDLVYEAVI